MIPRLLSVVAVLLLLATGCGKPEQPPQTDPVSGANAPLGEGEPVVIVAQKNRFHVILEAEDGEFTAPFAAREGADISGKALGIELGAGKPPEVTGKISCKFELPVDKPAFLWFRVNWKGECSNSLNVKLAGQPEHVIGQDGTYNAWHWVKIKGPGLKLGAGTHSVDIVQREDGVALDQILITSDDKFVPMGVEQ